MRAFLVGSPLQELPSSRPKALAPYAARAMRARMRRSIDDAGCFPLCVSLHLFRSMGFPPERNRPPPRPRPVFRFPPGLSRKGVRRFGERAEPPFVLFVCQDDAERDDFLASADHELTGHHWHPTHTPDQHKYIGRRHILFCNERDAHHGQCQARRLPPYPPGHPARRGHDAEGRVSDYPAARRGWSRERSLSEAGSGEAGCIEVARLPAGGAGRVSERVPGLKSAAHPAR